MKIKLGSIMAGPGGVNNPGDVVIVDDSTGRELIKHHGAEEIADAPVKAQPEPEVAAVAPPETADVKTPRARQNKGGK